MVVTVMYVNTQFKAIFIEEEIFNLVNAIKVSPRPIFLLFRALNTSMIESGGSSYFSPVKKSTTDENSFSHF